jgi:cytosine/adenosine deaminase-related metal-dependent hydrolase
MQVHPSTTTTVSARWVFPVSAPPIPGGIVSWHGDRITSIEPAGSRAVDLDLGNTALLPGLVNTHTHLDLSAMRGAAPPSPDFTGWLHAVIGHRRSLSLEEVANSIQLGLSECTRFGTTLVGDISALGTSWSELRAAPLRAVVFFEILGLSADRALAAREAARAWLASHPPTPTCRPGVSPHAPYSVRASLFNDANQLADAANAVLATHLAESAAEMELLDSRSGPFVPFLQGLGVWDPDGLAPSAAKIIRSCTSHGVRTLLVHGNFLKPSTVIPPNATLVYCPRTHQAFGHPSHPLREFLTRGVRVALGTDSLASNPDLDVLAEARFVREHFPEVPGERILRMATLHGAEALGFGDETGSLEVGKSADMVAIPLPSAEVADPHDLLLRGSQRVARVLFRGRFLPSSLGGG